MSNDTHTTPPEPRRMDEPAWQRQVFGAMKYPWVWDYPLTKQEFDDILDGKLIAWGALDRDWAAVRLIEWNTYPRMIQRLGYAGFVDGWPRWRSHVRDAMQRNALDFAREWLITRHPETLNRDAN